jgi:hypothetical protein
MAKWMPFSSRPGIGRSRGLVAPVATMMASKSLRSCSAVMSVPTLTLQLEGDAFVFEQLHAAEDDFLLVELHVGDAIHEEAAGTVGTLEDGDGVAGFVELRGGAEAGGAGTDDGDFLAGALLQAARASPSLHPSLCR